MGKQKKKTRRDTAEIEQVGGEKLTPGNDQTKDEDQPKKDTRDPAAVALSRLGASKGGKARAASLTAKRRKEIARKAARARWQKKK